MATATINFNHRGYFNPRKFLGSNSNRFILPNNASISFPDLDFYSAQTYPTTISYEIKTTGDLPTGNEPESYVDLDGKRQLRTIGDLSSNSFGAYWIAGKRSYETAEKATEDDPVAGVRNDYEGAVQTYIVRFGATSDVVTNDGGATSKAFFNILLPDQTPAFSYQKLGFLVRSNAVTIATGNPSGLDPTAEDTTDFAATIGVLEFRINRGDWINVDPLTPFRVEGKFGWNLLEMRNTNLFGFVSHLWSFINVAKPLYNPIADFSWSDLYAQTNEESDSAKVNFDASLSSDIDGTIVNYKWQFSDNQQATNTLTPFFQRDFGVREGDSSRTFLAQLTVTDNDGLTGTLTKQITVKDVEVSAQIDALVLADGRVFIGAQDGVNIVTRVLMPTTAGLKQLESSTINNAKLPGVAARRDASLARTYRLNGSAAVVMENSFDGGKAWQ